MRLLWEDRAWEDYLYWQTQDKKTLKRINALIKDILPIVLYIMSKRGLYTWSHAEGIMSSNQRAKYALFLLYRKFAHSRDWKMSHATALGARVRKRTLCSWESWERNYGKRTR